MQEKANDAAFSKLVSTYSNSGLFTHAYAETGKLTDKLPKFSYLLTPDRRDIFDLASMTKGLVTAPLVFNHCESGLKLEGSVAAALAGSDAADLSPKILNLKIKDLLAHKSGLPWWRNFYVNCSAAEEIPTLASVEKKMLAVLNRAAEDLDTSKKESYSDLGFLLLGLILTRRRQKDLSKQFQEFYPTTAALGYPDAIPSLSTKAVATSYCAIRGRKLCGEVHDENCAALGGITGHSGLFGSGAAVGNYLKFLSSSSAGALCLKTNAEAAATPDHSTHLFGLWSGQDFTDGKPGSFAIGHPGFTGTAFWISPAKNSYSVLLTNRVMSGRRPGTEIRSFRKDALNLLYRMSM